MLRIIALLASFHCAAAAAVDVALIGVVGDKAAVFAVDGGEPKAVKIGQTWNGINLIAVERGEATVEIGGKRRVLKIGQHHRSAAAPAAVARTQVKLAADDRGMFVSEGAINGVPVRFMVDTGATFVSMSARDATRMGIDFQKGRQVTMQTANGRTLNYLVKLDRVKLGDIELTDIEGVVGEQEMPFALLGMSFLNRVEMLRDGPTMMLTRRF
jgi:aspartyl protease family protein